MCSLVKPNRLNPTHAHLPRVRMDVFKKQKTYADPDCPVRDEILKWAIKNKKELFAKLCKVRGWEQRCKGEIFAEAQFAIHKGDDENIKGEIVEFADLFIQDDVNHFLITIKSKVSSFGLTRLRELKLLRHNVAYAWELELEDVYQFYTFVLLAPSIGEIADFEDLIREDECFLAIDYCTL